MQSERVLPSISVAEPWAPAGEPWAPAGGPVQSYTHARKQPSVVSGQFGHSSGGTRSLVRVYEYEYLCRKVTAGYRNAKRDVTFILSKARPVPKGVGKM
jgi:hypothetical protein